MTGLCVWASACAPQATAPDSTPVYSQEPDQSAGLVSVERRSIVDPVVTTVEPAEGNPASEREGKASVEDAKADRPEAPAADSEESAASPSEEEPSGPGETPRPAPQQPTPTTSLESASNGEAADRPPKNPPATSESAPPARQKNEQPAKP